LQETPEFDLIFDKSYKWIASSFSDKNAFIVSLWKASVVLKSLSETTFELLIEK
jgi:hypothetical protein